MGVEKETHSQGCNRHKPLAAFVLLKARKLIARSSKGTRIASRLANWRTGNWQTEPRNRP
jgi:hypothetical protein